MHRYKFHFTAALLAFGIVSFLSSYASAQEKSIEKSSNQNVIKESEFKEILSKATENLKDKTYRLTKTEENFADRNAASESVKINILEIIPPDKRREVEEVKSATKKTRLERIWDGKNLYEKKDNGEWKKYSGGGGMSQSITSGKVTTTYRFIGKESLNEKNANVYETETRRVAYKLTQTSQYRVVYITKTKYWISEDGHFLKTLKESEVVGSNSLQRETEVYEYDANIKIEAPIK